jgi:SAM-dependent methyltransferase
MCTPVPEHLKGKFSFVLDGGTLEHVFDYPAAIKNCMEMVRPGGHLLLITPTNNCFGHGFYQFSPELFYSLLTERNGYSDTQVFIQDDRHRWYRVVSPQKIRRRVDSCLAFRNDILIHVLSRRVGEVPARLTVLQSDYVTKWSGAEETPPKDSPAGTVLVAPGPLFHVYSLYRSLPIGLRKWLTPVLLARPSLRRFLAWRWARRFYEPCDEISSM